MKVSEFRRWLAAQGATFKEGAAHTKAYYQGKQTTLLGEGLRKAILKQLGIR